MKINTERYLKQISLVLSAALLVLALFSIGGPGMASAHNDSCGIDESANWHCTWYDPNQEPGAQHWFNAAVTLRNWYAASVSDGNGGGVTQKCVHVKRSSDGAEQQVACGSGFQSGGIASNWKPGWLFTRHGAASTRFIYGGGWNPN